MELVVDDDQVRLWADLKFLYQLPHRYAAQVHERLGLCQDNVFLPDDSLRRERPTLPVFNFDFQLVGEAIDGQKAQVVRRELIFDSRIAEANDQLHAFSVSACKLSSLARPDGRGRPSPHGPCKSPDALTSFLLSQASWAHTLSL